MPGQDVKELGLELVCVIRCLVTEAAVRERPYEMELLDLLDISGGLGRRRNGGEQGKRQREDLLHGSAPGISGPHG